MIQMYFLPGKELCLEQGRSFVNSRLIGLMENVMAEYAQIGDDSYMEKITSSEDWEKPLETIIDLDRMRKDEGFVTGWLREYELIPQTIGPQRGLQDFFSLYDLLKAKEEYKPSLSMEYILLGIIDMELDFCKDMPEYHQRVKRIPEPLRSQMMQELLEEAKESREEDPDTEETDEEFAEELMAYYEDLEQYINICFEDTDCLFLDDMDEDEMEESGFADLLGVHITGDSRKMQVIHNSGKTKEYDVSPWKQDEISKQKKNDNEKIDK